MKTTIFAGAALLLGSSYALAQDVAGPAEATTTVAEAVESETTPENAEDDPGQEVICRTERITGSLTRRRRTCMTRDEWRIVESGTRDGLNAMGRNASGGVQCRQDQMGGC